jgi:hypothetical protein
MEVASVLAPIPDREGPAEAEAEAEAEVLAVVAAEEVEAMSDRSSCLRLLRRSTTFHR